ncbi:MAG: prepilin-type N-terminal cleavage/methylation domain-containing protein [Clostridiaceae bacterium]|nr:prepilin-type N-terminal cleavage/methylation domain-containing protein [Clostridiaceae bacterium]
MYKKNKNAFTLAEVLITLGIIGVIAALTIPMLVASYQKRVLVTQYKTNYSILSQGFQKMISSEGVSDFGDTEYLSSVFDQCTGDGWCMLYKIPNTEIMRKYFNCVSIEPQKTVYYYSLNSKSRSSDGFQVYNFVNGASLLERTWHEKFLTSVSSTRLYGSYLIDVNGIKKKPNTIGRDMFAFWISNTGKVVAQGSKEYALLTGDNGRYWQNASAYSNNGCRATNYYGPGRGCAGRVIEENWEMNY